MFRDFIVGSICHKESGTWYLMQQAKAERRKALKLRKLGNIGNTAFRLTSTPSTS